MNKYAGSKLSPSQRSLEFFQKRNKTNKSSRKSPVSPDFVVLFIINSETYPKFSLVFFLMNKKIFTKTYRLIKSDNYDAFLKEAGASVLERRHEQRERPTLQLRQHGNEYILRRASEHGTHTVNFRPHERFVRKGFDGKNVQTIMSFENGNTLVEMQMGQKPVTILREFFENGVVEMMMCEKTVCCRVFSSSE